MTAPLTVDGVTVASPDLLGAGPSTGDGRGDGHGDGGRVTSVFRRYEVIAATVAVIVVIVRLSGGGFLADISKPAAPVAAPGVAPFTEGPAAGEPPAADAAAPTLSPEVEAALPAGPLPASVRSALTPSTVAPASGAGAASVVPGATAAPETAQFADGGRLGEASVLASVPAPGAPAAVVVGSAGDVWVGTDNGGGQGAAGTSVVLHYGPDGTLLKTFPLDGAAGVTALATGPGTSLYLASRTPAAVFSFDTEAGSLRKLADIPDATPCVPPVVTVNCDGSVANAAPAPSALAVDRSSTIFVADAAQGAIWKVPSTGGTAAQLSATREWTNPTRPAGPSALAFDGKGNLVVAVRSLLTEDAGAIFLQPIAADGTAGVARELARTDQGSRPAGLALSASGKVYVTLSGTGRVLVLGTDGKEQAKTPSSSAPPLDTPVGVAFRGQSLIVVAQAPSRPDGGQVFRLPVGETGAPRLFS